MAYDDFLIDKRVVERNIKKGLVDEEALKRQIEALPDRESNLVHVSLEGAAQVVEDEVDDDEDDEDDEEDLESDDSVEPQG